MSCIGMYEIDLRGEIQPRERRREHPAGEAARACCTRCFAETGRCATAGRRLAPLAAHSYPTPQSREQATR